MKRLAYGLALLILFALPAVAGGEEGTVFRAATSQTASYQGTSIIVTDHFGTNTQVIRVVATGDSYINIERNIVTLVATTATGFFLPANVVEYLIVSPLNSIAVRASGTSLTTLRVTEMTK